MFEAVLDFFNWNKVKIRYCDGASLAGHPENEFHVSPVVFVKSFPAVWMDTTFCGSFVFYYRSEQVKSPYH